MPGYTKRLCPVTGCSGIYDPATRTCSRCGKRQKTGWDRSKQRGTRQQRGYGRRWEKLRKRKLEVDPLCLECQRNGYTMTATQVHHIVPFHGPTDPLLYDWDNLESICGPCHVRKSAEAGGSRRKGQRNA